ncbi:MAG: class I SAM-dependent methyltransferase, partial [Candidatus Omnitrophota bacterium]|nr:class I SAM-dependent methyltransferase [Candidatus Omnitrophota bacterium]
DVSPIFLRLGNQAIMKIISEGFNYSLKKIDFEKPLFEQGIDENSIDMVYGVNALHVAKDLSNALSNIYKIIKPGGKIILSECCRPTESHLLLQEFIFNLLDSYVNVKLDPYFRPVPGFLDYEHWKRNLEAAGFKDIEALLNTDVNYTQFSEGKAPILAIVIKGEKS